MTSCARARGRCRGRREQADAGRHRRAGGRQERLVRRLGAVLPRCCPLPGVCRAVPRPPRGGEAAPGVLGKEFACPRRASPFISACPAIPKTTAPTASAARCIRIASAPAMKSPRNTLTPALLARHSTLARTTRHDERRSITMTTATDYKHRAAQEYRDLRRTRTDAQALATVAARS